MKNLREAFNLTVNNILKSLSPYESPIINNTLDEIKTIQFDAKFPLAIFALLNDIINTLAAKLKNIDISPQIRNTITNVQLMVRGELLDELSESFAFTQSELTTSSTNSSMTDTTSRVVGAGDDSETSLRVAQYQLDPTMYSNSLHPLQYMSMWTGSQKNASAQEKIQKAPNP